MSDNVVISGRVRLARNYFDLPFSDTETPENEALCIERAKGALGDDYTLYSPSELSNEDGMALVEQHLISLDLLKNRRAGAAMIRGDSRVSVMLNEEDHLRIQAIVPGNELANAARDAFEVEEKLGDACAFSFDPLLGYLTSCPTNAGTGMRASLMLHLPLLTRFKQIGSVYQSVAKIGLTMRGIYGEGSEALGDLYQVSNQVTLGRTEDDIIEAVSAVGKQLIGMEEKLRERALVQRSDALEDSLMRSYGIMLYAVEMNASEFMQHWSSIRLGAALGMLKTSTSALDELLTMAQDAHVKKYLKANALEASVAHARCDIIRLALQPTIKEA